MSKIKYDTLYYNTGSGWQAVSHISFITPDTFIYQLPSLTNNTTVNYYFAATDSSVNQNRGVFPTNAPATYLTFKILPTAGVNVLLGRSAITDANNIENTAFTHSLNANGIVYDVYNWDEFSTYNFPSDYKTIFVYANSASAIDRYDTLSRALMTFLDLGTNADPKNLFMASDDFAYAGYGFQNEKPMLKFFEAYIRSGYIPQVNYPFYGGTDGIGGPDIYDYSYGSIIGFANSPIGENNVEIPVYSNSPDNIYNRACPSWYEADVSNPAISSQISFLFEDGPIAGHAYSYHNPCGIWLDNLIYKSFFLSFDLSQLSSSGIYSIIGDADTWFNILVSAEETNTGKINRVNIYPNPSNGKFTVNIPQSLNLKQASSLEIYDMVGRLIMSSIIQNQKIKIDLNNYPKGIYFVKIYNGEKIHLEKIVIQ